MLTFKTFSNGLLTYLQKKILAICLPSLEILCEIVLLIPKYLKLIAAPAQS
jgi:hypothetical protein